jgi:hypothetical protein
MKKKLSYLLYIAVFLLAVEVFLRLYFGFCDTVLMREDPDYEYIAQPSQNRFRFRNHIKYNALSMRSEEVDTTAHLILGLGDSVINGGVQTDHDSLATTILSDSLSKREGKKLQFLNISAGSWGPDNCFAYLKKHGDFGAGSFFLFVSSHDAYDNMTFDKIVDVNVSFPSKQYASAIYELFDRYILPRVKAKFEKPAAAEESLAINKETENAVLNTGFDSILSYTKGKNIPLTIYIHAEKSELKAGAYNDQGQKIIRFAQQNKINLIRDLDNGLSIEDFRDDIHINAKGQRKLAATVLNYLKNQHY